MDDVETLRQLKIRVAYNTGDFKNFFCLSCGTPLGETDGLLFATKEFTLSRIATLRCKKCGTIRVWRPVKANVYE